MEILGNLFNIVIFTTIIGALFWISMYIIKCVMHLFVPLCIGIVGMSFFFFPITIPNVQLIPAEQQTWYFGYQVASVIWCIGVIVVGGYFLLRYLLVIHNLKKWSICIDDCVLQKIKKICLMYNIEKMPTIFYTDLKIDVCVVTLVHPVILLNREVLKQLTDLELYIILGHELMHIKRKHHLLRRMFDVVSAIQWFNPIVWIAKGSFELICEIDCDKYTISKLKGIGSNSYLTTMIHLCELSLGFKTELIGGMKAAGKNFIKQRFIAIYQRRSGRKYILQILILIVLILGNIWISGKVSSAHFYPYPAFDSAPEYNLER